MGIGIVGRLVCLGLVGRLDLAVLRIDSQEVLLPIGRGIFLAGCRGVEMLGLLEVWCLGGYGSLWMVNEQLLSCFTTFEVFLNPELGMKFTQQDFELKAFQPTTYYRRPT